MNFRLDRNNMVDEQLLDRGISSRRVLAAMRKIPRENFVTDQYKEDSYFDGPLPIGYGQTISQPYMVARMVELLDLSGNERVLEVGLGSGYQAAVLSVLAKKVYGIEVIPELAEEAAENLKNSRISNVEILVGDGTQGWPEKAPFERIIVAAGAREIPEKLKGQLSIDGIMVIPIDSGFNQIVTVVKNNKNGFELSYIEPCVFVPLIGKY